MRSKSLTLLTIVWIAATLPGRATLPVIDYGAIAQAIQQTLKQVQQYAQQVQSYQLQLTQYANMVKNTVAPVSQIYSQAQSTMQSVMNATKVFSNGSQLQNTLNQFQSPNYWLTASPSQYTWQTGGLNLQKQSNDAMIRGIVQQQDQITQDAANLQRLQAQAGSADGQMKAMMAAAQLAALENQQLLQIRALLTTEQQAAAARAGTTSNRESMQQSATQQLFYSPNTFEDHQEWHP
jgi:P-type conjugative transfer protein TrbJ